MIDVFSNLEVLCEGEEPWCDLSFEVTGVRRAFFHRAVTLTCAAAYGGETVGFGATIRAKDWKRASSQEEGSVPFWWGRLVLNSVGDSSDNLLRLMQNYYRMEEGGAFPTTIECPAVTLDGDPTNLMAAPLRMKLFFFDESEEDGGEQDDEGEDNYAELYFNLDLRARLAALNEKDPDYREPLIGWLSGRWGTA